MQAGRNRHEHIMESLELFAAEVLPEFKDRDEKLRADKAKRFAPIIEAALARRPDDSPPMPEGYTMCAIPKAMVNQAGNEEIKGWMDKLADRQATGERDEGFERAIFG
jgi:hypothetical protein